MILQPLGVDDLLGAVPAAVVAVEAGGRVVLVNDEWRTLMRRLVGRTHSVDVGDDFRTSLAPAASERSDLTERLETLVERARVAVDGRTSAEVELPTARGSAPHVISAQAVHSAVVDVTSDGSTDSAFGSAVVVLTALPAYRSTRVGDDGSDDWRDPITGLATRRLYVEMADHVLGVARRRPYRVALVCVRLDAVAPLTATHGSDVRDQLIAAVALRASGCIRPGDVMARVADDRFVVLLPDLLHESVADIVAGRLLAELSEPFSLDERLIDVEPRVGSAIAERHDTAADLLAAATAAAGAARRVDLSEPTTVTADPSTSVVPEPPMHRASTEPDTGAEPTSRRSTSPQEPTESGDVELDIRDLADPQLLTYFQPIVDLESSAVVGAEALMRWNHPRHGVLDAASFIRLASDAGLLGSIANAALIRAGATWSDMRAQMGSKPPQLFINLSPEQLADPMSVERIMEHLQRAGLSHDDVVLEITEGALGGRFNELVDQFAALRSHGLRLAIDDFGAGYSSLGRLRHLHVQVLKIDRTMSRGIETDERARSLLASVASMCVDLGIDCVVEGCESARQAHVLADLGFRYVQGYHFGRPSDSATFLAQLRRRRLLAAGGG